MTYLYACNAIVFALLFMIWSKNDWLNMFVKAGLFSLSCGNVFYLLSALGYIVKA